MAATPLLDSIVTKDGKGNYTKLEQHFYDDKNKEVNTVVYQWTNGVKKGTSNSYKAYDESNREVLTLTLKWDATTNDWTANGASRTEKVWNASGQQTLQIQYTWNASQLKWSPSSVTEYGYTNGKQTMVRSSKLVNGKMTYSTLYEYHFDDQGTATGTDYYSSYDAAKEQWIGSSRTVQEYIYSPKKLKTKDETYSWSNGDWQVTKRQLWWFDANGNQIDMENYSTWSGGVCTKGSKTVQEFNAQNRVTMKETFSWNKTKKDWDKSSKTVTEYDGTTANKTLEESYSWSKDHYVGQSCVRTTYSSGKAVSVTNYTWDDTKREWFESEKNENTYSGSTLTQTSSLKLEDGVWVGYQTLYTYTNGKLTESLTQQFNDPDWVNYTRTRNEYKDGTNVATYMEEWNGSQWVLTHKTWTELVYDNGNLIEEAYYDSVPGVKTGKSRVTYIYENTNLVNKTTYQWKDQGWVGSFKYEYTYDSVCGKQSSSTKSIWVNTKWEGDSKDEWLYYADGTLYRTNNYLWYNGNTFSGWRGNTSNETVINTSTEKQTISYTWNYEDWCWIGMFRQTYKMQNGKEIFYTKESYNSDEKGCYDSQNWSFVEKRESQYDGQNLIHNEEFNWIDGAWVSRKLSDKKYDETSGVVLQTTDTNDGVTTISDYFYHDPK